MGKSTTAGLLEERGFPVADTDAIAREVVLPQTPALEEIREAFGPDILDSDGRLDRARLGERVFEDATARQRLEEIVHPRIRAEWLRRVATWRSAGSALGAVIIPLLYETAAESVFDAVLCVACSGETQRVRLRERGWSEEHLEKRIAAQIPVETKIRRADFLLWTEATMEIHGRQLDNILKTLVTDA